MSEKNVHLFTIDKFPQSSWLRDALSELDPSCERLTFIGHPPPPTQHQNASAANENTDVKPRPIRHAIMKPMLRIQATGAFGSAEVWKFKYPPVSAFLEAHKNLTVDGLPQRPGRLGNIRVHRKCELQVIILILIIYIREKKNSNK